VVPVNPDFLDTLGVEPAPFLHPSFYVKGILRVGEIGMIAEGQQGFFTAK
jgi:hypothetical protein